MLSPYAETLKEFAEARPVLFVGIARILLMLDVARHILGVERHSHHVYCVSGDRG